MCVNIGHGDPRVVKAIHEQAEILTYVTPAMATEPRARLGAKLATITPGDLDVFFLTNGGAEANENAFKIARAYTGRQKILARYRSYHGGTAAAIAATGEPRSWSQAPLPGIVHVLDPYHGIERGWESVDSALRYLDEVIQLEGPHTIAAFILESVTGTNGILVPPDGYMQGVRALCDKYGILMIADEVMSGFGRTGRWFAIEHWGVVPDMITMAKGLTSAYVQLGAVGIRQTIAEVREGLAFVRRNPWCWATLLSAMFSLLVFIGPVQVLLPYLVKNRLGLGPEALGAIFAVSGVGAIGAAIAVGQLGLPRRRITIMYVVWSAGVALFALAAIATKWARIW